MIETLTQIGQTPPTTAFMLGFSMALALRRGRVEQIMNGVFSRSDGSSGSTEDKTDQKEDNADNEDSSGGAISTSADEWERKQIEQ